MEENITSLIRNSITSITSITSSDVSHYDYPAYISIDSYSNTSYDRLGQIEKENRELRKIIANLSTRVNNLIAERQLEKLNANNNKARTQSN